MKNFVIKIICVVIGCVFLSTTCDPVYERGIFSVVNVGNNPICVDITAYPNDCYQPIDERCYLSPNERWNYYEDLLYPEKDKFYTSRFPGKYKTIKFVVMPCDKKMRCIDTDTLDVIEMTIGQFDMLHRCLYYPMPEQDKIVLKRNN